MITTIWQNVEDVGFGTGALVAVVATFAFWVMSKIQTRE